ncbi:MBL fold metallo-hydrolase [Phycicoccus endophyticus]|uniref:MBL fold metallo-hydrolase n=1 Tax=Phycicoccus endophyticus TaxID=1690220 RepID=A0A7G9QZN4_9MICO|nr:alkyl sulfatase dimerization domain-containing protein [Phycicoccus endophyticus]NHI20001.1 MBL fold metallo-hydrolase [Phycicoccus endophyticus]QNN48809.1 MBL fold metallo-hydrolase [Phycicoccus endophyticus]GGL42725.1 beta-lactamase-like protein [Phycicoccus endophyticus]
MTVRNAPGHRAASPSTRAAHAAATDALPWEDERDLADAERGFVASLEPLTIRDERGSVVWDLEPYEFVDGPAPDTVHPSLWRMARLSRRHGLFRVTDGLYQVRGFDISNMSVIEGETGYVVIDPLTCVETAAAAMDLVRRELGDRPVTGLVYTHGHIDHFGGAAGVLPDGRAPEGMPVIAPVGFTEHAVSEHIHAGVAVSRRSQLMFGKPLSVGPRGQVTAGLGFTLPAGSISLVEPTRLVGETGTEVVVDGVRLVFQFTPGAEAPAEVNVHLPDLRALCMAETVSHHMHNLYTLRGAEVRDALAWSTYLDEAIELFADRTDVMFISHHWPVWGRERVVEHIGMHRDLYRYLHDQTLRLANHGHTPAEIAELIELPPQLDRYWANRGNYGSLRHNAKAVYQRYIGWFDANPAHLDPLPPAESGSRYVALLGGTEAVLGHARAAVEADELRWAAELLAHGLAAEPDHGQLRALQADVFEQLGYRAESGPWRNFYLLAAAELRGEVQPVSTFVRSNAEMAPGMTASMLLDFLAIRLDGPRAAAAPSRWGLRLRDREESYVVEVDRGVLHHRRSTRPEDSTLVLDHPALVRLVLGMSTLEEAVEQGLAHIEGDPSGVRSAFDQLDVFAGDFSVVTPHPAHR